MNNVTGYSSLAVWEQLYTGTNIGQNLPSKMYRPDPENPLEKIEKERKQNNSGIEETVVVEQSIEMQEAPLAQNNWAKTRAFINKEFRAQYVPRVFLEAMKVQISAQAKAENSPDNKNIRIKAFGGSIFSAVILPYRVVRCALAIATLIPRLLLLSVGRTSLVHQGEIETRYGTRTVTVSSECLYQLKITAREFVDLIVQTGCILLHGVRLFAPTAFSNSVNAVAQYYFSRLDDIAGHEEALARAGKLAEDDSEEISKRNLAELDNVNKQGRA